jgi:hypothetical protein
LKAVFHRAESDLIKYLGRSSAEFGFAECPDDLGVGRMFRREGTLEKSNLVISDATTGLK